MGYATVDDYELRTHQDIPDEQEPQIQQLLDDCSALIELYLGGCADEVATAYPDVLTALCCSQVYYGIAVPPGVRSESVGGTSVSYAEVTSQGGGLSSSAKELLDDLIDKACPTNAEVPGLGSVGSRWGGSPSNQSDTAWMRDVDVWVM